MLKTTNKNVIGKIFNVGTGKSITIKKLVEIIQKKTNGGKPVFGKKALKKNEILFSQAHVGKIKKYINWSSKISIENGINILIKNGK